MPLPCVSHTSVLLGIDRLGGSGAVMARLGSTGLEYCGLQSLPCLLRDMFTARRSHCVENHNEVIAINALHLDEVDDSLDVLKKLVTLSMLVGLMPGVRQEARGGRDGGQLIEVPAQNRR